MRCLRELARNTFSNRQTDTACGKAVTLHSKMVSFPSDWLIFLLFSQTSGGTIIEETNPLMINDKSVNLNIISKNSNNYVLILNVLFNCTQCQRNRKTYLNKIFKTNLGTKRFNSRYEKYVLTFHHYADDAIDGWGYVIERHTLVDSITVSGDIVNDQDLPVNSHP